MSPSIACRCPHCDDVFLTAVSAGETLRCPHCGAGAWTVPEPGRAFERCAICGCDRFFRQKDFNKVLGLLVVIVAAVFVPATYGLSMAAAFLVDWALYARTPELVRCYRCKSEYRNFPIPDRIKLYDHYTAEMIQVSDPARP